MKVEPTRDVWMFTMYCPGAFFEMLNHLFCMWRVFLFILFNLNSVFEVNGALDVEN